MSRNEPGSRISFNLRSPDHLRWIPGPEKNRLFSGKNSIFFRSIFVFFERFSRFLKPGNTPGMILNDSGKNDFRRFSSIFVGIFGGRPIYVENLDNSRKFMINHDKSRCIMMHHDFARKIVTFQENRHLAFARVILRHSPFDGGTPIPLPRGDLPPRVFLPRPR